MAAAEGVVMLVRELRALLDGVPDDMPVVVDGYEGGLSYPTPLYRIVGLDAEAGDYHGEHKAVSGYELDSEMAEAWDEPLPPLTWCLMLARYSGELEHEERSTHRALDDPPTPDDEPAPDEPPPTR